MEEKGKQGARSTYIFSVDSFSNGIAFGQHPVSDSVSEETRRHYRLRLDQDQEVVRLRSRYVLRPHRDQSNCLHELEANLMRLSNNGILRSSEIFFGTTTDPFHPFEHKFDASMKFLEIFRRYVPGMLHVQTRSPLIVLALPIFKALGKNVTITLGVETNCEKSRQRYTPDLPRIEERLKTAQALRRFGIEVHIQVGPVLPYGDWKTDAKGFAQTLVDHADFIRVLPLTDGSSQSEKRLRKNAVALRVAEDRKFHWLRTDSAVPLLNAIHEIAPEKLEQPVRKHMEDRQLNIFAA
ncbi:MAG: hypothetical protein KDD62_11035 [Bdellovibrionales bacterium]|nr:hypothetical protein [Bdellovibrionales bacterium]